MQYKTKIKGEKMEGEKNCDNCQFLAKISSTNDKNSYYYACTHSSHSRCGNLRINGKGAEFISNIKTDTPTWCPKNEEKSKIIY